MSAKLSRMSLHLAAAGREFNVEDIRDGLFTNINSLALLVTHLLIVEYFRFPRPIQHTTRVDVIQHRFCLFTFSSSR
jgi:hypothetical protein